MCGFSDNSVRENFILEKRRFTPIKRINNNELYLFNLCQMWKKNA